MLPGSPRGPALDPVQAGGLAEASSDHVSFLAEPRYREQLLGTQAAGVLVEADFESTRDDLTLLRCANPSRAFNRIVLAFAQPQPACTRRPSSLPTSSWVKASTSDRWS